ncbi:MAG TPA: hypothetical protein VHD55_01035 [Candidatus Paceibacterota bacterium]|nr:hypothetical protein [Candidatus Paceibacterota bacterium]
MRPASYIGVTGFMNREEIHPVLAALPLGAQQLVMVGVLVSGKTLRGMPNKYPRRYPKSDRISDIFFDRHNVLNLLHFATDEQEKLVGDMFRAQDEAGPHCHGFQINVPWPEKKILESYKKTSFFTRKTIVLQCGPTAIEACEGSAKKIAQRVRSYGDSIDYVLIDGSAGKGKRFDYEFAKRCFAELEKIEHVGFGIAGGLAANNLEQLRPLVRQFGAFSIDAEGRLRDLHDDLDVYAAQKYLFAAHNQFRRYETT